MRDPAGQRRTPAGPGPRARDLPFDRVGPQRPVAPQTFPLQTFPLQT